MLCSICGKKIRWWQKTELCRPDCKEMHIHPSIVLYVHANCMTRLRQEQPVTYKVWPSMDYGLLPNSEDKP